MCGLVGIINRETILIKKQKLSTYFKQALFADTLRGFHGTGITTITKAGVKHIIKKALPAPDFLNLKVVDNAISDTFVSFMMGHNRWATQGEHSDKNSHPFTHDHITMFHNGTLDFVDTLPKGNSFEVDSDAIAYSLSVEGTLKTISKLDGAFSLVWYDSERESLNFARNSSRPMVFGYVKDSESVIYASEEKMLIWLADRNNIDLSKIEVFDTGVHREIFLDDTKEVIDTSFTPMLSYYEEYYLNREYHQHSKVLSYPFVKTGQVICVDDLAFNNYPPIKGVPNRYGKLIGKYFTPAGNVVKAIFGGILEKDAEKLIGLNVSGIARSVETDCIFCSEPEETKRVSNKKKPKDLRIVGPSSRIIDSECFDLYTEEGCFNCACDLKKEDSVDIHWDAHSCAPYCKDCKGELYEND